MCYVKYVSLTFTSIFIFEVLKMVNKNPKIFINIYKIIHAIPKTKRFSNIIFTTLKSKRVQLIWA